MMNKYFPTMSRSWSTAMLSGIILMDLPLIVISATFVITSTMRVAVASLVPSVAERVIVY